MRITIFLLVLGISFLVINMSTKTQPSFNGTTPGCSGSSCHTSAQGIVSAEVLSNFQVKITVSGTTASVAGELVDTANNVVAVNNSTSSNPFILTAPSAGTYTVNAGFKNPSRQWGSTTVNIAVTGISDQLIDNIPGTYALYANYPNPFNPATKIRYALKNTGYTTLKVYDLPGNEIATLVNGVRQPGIYEVSFDALNLPSGTYIYRLTSGSYSETRKMVLLK